MTFKLVIAFLAIFLLPTAFFLSWDAPTEFFGKTSLLAAWLSGVAANTAMMSAVIAMIVGVFEPDISFSPSNGFRRGLFVLTTVASERARGNAASPCLEVRLTAPWAVEPLSCYWSRATSSPFSRSRSRRNWVSSAARASPEGRSASSASVSARCSSSSMYAAVSGSDATASDTCSE